MVGVASVVAKNVAQQRSLAKARERKNKVSVAKVKVKAPKETRTAAEIEAAAATSRARLFATVAQIRFDLDIPARAGDLRDRVAVQFPRNWRGETPARAAASAVIVIGLSTIASITAIAVRARR